MQTDLREQEACDAAGAWKFRILQAGSGIPDKVRTAGGPASWNLSHRFPVASLCFT